MENLKLRFKLYIDILKYKGSIHSTQQSRWANSRDKYLDVEGRQKTEIIYYYLWFSKTDRETALLQEVQENK